jgi:hypothetical protein
LIFQNPYRIVSGDLKIGITISRPAEEIKLRIYTVAYRRIMEISCGAANTREAIITVPQWKLGRLAAGAYYVIVTGKSGDNERAFSKPVVLAVLR